MFPQSVPTQSSSGRRKGRRVKVRSGPDEPVQDTTPATVGVGGVEVDFGRPGAARLVKHGAKWGWDWAVGHDPGELLGYEAGVGGMLIPGVRLQAGDEAVELYPGQKRLAPSAQDITVKQQVSAVVSRAFVVIGWTLTVDDLPGRSAGSLRPPRRQRSDSTRDRGQLRSSLASALEIAARSAVRP